MTLFKQQYARYKRNMLLPDMGEVGQLKLLKAKVLVVGAGGLGSPVLLYLAAAGVGTLGICDADRVDFSNLQRQIIHSTQRVGMEKCDSARQAIRELNPDVEVVVFQELLTRENAAQMFSAFDIIVDAVDNFTTKILISDVCVSIGKPFCHGALREYEGQIFTHVPGTAHYRSFFGEVPPEGDVPLAAHLGTLGAIAGIVGSIQAAECIKYICGTGQLLVNRLMCIDALTMNVSFLEI